ncbi:MAG: oxidoreductase domain-containing protein, partial [Bacteroidetes bacterium]|nr:oxidoreductase domain-containing protein [Bacteroidota bacterium]
MKKIEIGLIGLGYWGKNLLRNFHSLGVLRFACDTSSSIIAERRKEFPDVAFGSSPEEVFASNEITAVAIATPA